MVRLVLLVSVFLVAASVCVADPNPGTDAANINRGKLDATTIANALMANPDEEAYVVFVCALVDQGVLPQRLVERLFQWARGKPFPKKGQYFIYGLREQAGKIGVHLPLGKPPLKPDIRGRVVQTVGGFKMPIAEAVVSLRGTKRTTRTDKKGRFVFEKVSYGIYTVDATKRIFLITWHGNAKATLPNLHSPSLSDYVEVELKLGAPPTNGDGGIFVDLLVD